MPAEKGALFPGMIVICDMFRKLATLIRTDYVKIRVSVFFITRIIVQWMNMQARGRRLSSKFAKALNQLLLEIVREVVLCTKKDDAPLGN